jgi:3'-phosphoadenosine 5'-phosphosulfate sulfotransferase (PAPS reductase)/FAD synthetase
MKLSDKYRGGNSMMLDGWELNAELKKPYEQKLEETKAFIRAHLDNFKRPQVSTSWGKDSTVMSALICDICLNEKKMNPRTTAFPTFILVNTRNIYREEPEYWEKIRIRLGIPKVKFLVFKSEWDDGTPATVWNVAKKVGYLPSFRRTDRHDIPHEFRDEPKCCEILKRRTINKYLKKQKKFKRFDLVFVGTRAEESQARRFSVMMNCRTFSSRKKRVYVSRTCTPLAFWTDKDIDRYMEENNLEKCPVYERHNQKRIGCASCPAHLNWEKRLADDPTGEGRGMLELNLQILRVTQPNRFWNSISRLYKDHKDICDKIINSPELEEWRNKVEYDEDLMEKAKKVKALYEKK